MMAWLLIITGLAGLLGLVFLILFFRVGQPFGTLNDIFIALTAILSGVIAWLFSLYLYNRAPFLSQAVMILAILGAIIVVIGSVLVISGLKGWFYAGLFMSAGNGLIGLWLLSFSYFLIQDSTWPRGLIILGLVTAGIMALGLAAFSGIFKSVEPQEAAGWVINYVGQASALGWLALYPVWCLLAGRFLLYM